MIATAVTTATATAIGKTVIRIEIDSGGAPGRKGKMREKETATIVIAAAGNASERTLAIMRISRQLRAVRCRHHSIKLKIPLNPPFLETMSLSPDRRMWLRPLFTILMFNNNFLDSFQPTLLSLTDRQIPLVKRPITMVTKDSLSKTSRVFDQSHRWLSPTANRT